MLHQVGAGVLGPVFRAHDPERDRLVAVKVFRLDLTPEQVADLAAALEELVAHALTHPSIVAPVGAGVEGSVAYLAQEYVQAESLDVAVRQYGPAPLPHALRVLSQLAGALDFAGAVGIRHGALHPRDVLVSPEEARITGLGVAQALERVGVRAPTRRPYSPSERIEETRNTAAADIHALAAIGYELMVGQRLKSSHVRLSGRIHVGDRAAVEAAFERALSADATGRYASALGFVTALGAGVESGAARESGASSRRRGAAPDVAGSAASLPLTPTGSDEAAERPAPPPAEPPAPPPREKGPRSEFVEALRLNEPPKRPKGLRARPESEEPQPPAVLLPLEEPAAEEGDTVADEASAAPPAAAREEVPEIDALFSPEPDSAAGEEGLKVRDESPGHGNRRVEPEVLVSGDEAGAKEWSELDLRAESAVPFEDRQAIEEPPARETAVAGPIEFGELEGADTWDPEKLADADGQADELEVDEPGPPVPASRERPRWQQTPAAVLAVLFLFGVLVGFVGGYVVGVRAGAGSQAADAPATSPSTTPAPQAGEPTRATVTERGAEGGGVSTPASPPGAPREQLVQPPAEAAPPAPRPVPAPAGRLVVRTRPAGATVIVDGEARGASPQTITGLTLDRHTIRVTRPGYSDREQQITLTRARPSRDLTVTLTRAAPPARATAAPAGAAAPQRAPFRGSMSIDSRPAGARVLLDGKPVGKTPLVLNDVAIGSHVVRLEMTGYRPWTASSQVTAGTRTKVTGSLDRERRP